MVRIFKDHHHSIVGEKHPSPFHRLEKLTIVPVWNHLYGHGWPKLPFFNEWLLLGGGGGWRWRILIQCDAAACSERCLLRPLFQLLQQLFYCLLFVSSWLCSITMFNFSFFIMGRGGLAGHMTRSLFQLLFFQSQASRRERESRFWRECSRIQFFACFWTDNFKKGW